MPDAIALISGGKDSLLALYYAVQAGYTIVALGNLHPPTTTVSSNNTTTDSNGTVCHHPSAAPTVGAPALLSDELDSYMYQTVGHSLLPLIAYCINLPLYRRAIAGTPRDTDLEYEPNDTVEDETEDLTVLLKSILASHPTVTAVTSGAIKSSYQRNRIESVCTRLSLTSLAYLWETPQREVLRALQNGGFDARIVKAAAMDLDGRWLWRSVADDETVRDLEKLEEKWGINVAGEGGEYETLVVDAPGWRAKIVVDEEERVGNSDGGASYLTFRGARVVTKKEEGMEMEEVARRLPVPPLLEEMFQGIHDAVNPPPPPPPHGEPETTANLYTLPPMHSLTTCGSTIHLSNLTAPPSSRTSLTSEATAILTTLHDLLPPSKYTITSTTLLLSSMTSFTEINALYTTYLPHILPPARLCIAVPISTRLALSATAEVTGLTALGGLHIQSHSHWAPANIGPYSQSTFSNHVYIAGQIPLIPSSMTPVEPENIVLQAVLSLQHLCRIADAVGTFISGATCWITDETTARVVVEVWKRWGGKHGESDIEKWAGMLVVAKAVGLPRGVGVEWGGWTDSPTNVEVRWDDDDVLLENDAVTSVEAVVDVNIFSSGGGVGKVIPAFGVWNGHGQRRNRVVIVRKK